MVTVSHETTCSLNPFLIPRFDRRLLRLKRNYGKLLSRNIYNKSLESKRDHNKLNTFTPLNKISAAFQLRVSFDTLNQVDRSQTPWFGHAIRIRPEGPFLHEAALYFLPLFVPVSGIISKSGIVVTSIL